MSQAKSVPPHNHSFLLPPLRPSGHFLQIHPQLLTSLWSILSSKTTSFDTMRSCAHDIILEGYPLTDILSKLHDDVINREELSDLDKALICDKIAQVALLCFLFSQLSPRPRPLFSR